MQEYIKYKIDSSGDIEMFYFNPGETKHQLYAYICFDTELILPSAGVALSIEDSNGMHRAGGPVIRVL